MKDGHEDVHMKAYLPSGGHYQLFIDEYGYRSLLNGPLEAELQDRDGGHYMDKKVILKLNRKALMSKVKHSPSGLFFEEIDEIRVIISKDDYEALWGPKDQHYPTIMIRNGGSGVDISIDDDLSGMI